MKVIRYSLNGFEPQNQTHHMNVYVLYHLNEFDVNQFPKHLQWEIDKIHKSRVALYEANYHDFERGIWVFIDGHKNNQSLNHLKRKVPCFEADLPDDIEVYDVNWSKSMKLCDPECKIFGCYVPERSLAKIKNIKRRKGNKNGKALYSE